MKKTLFLAFLVVPLLFCACGFDNLTVPKEVEVRTDATYEFYLAKLDSKKQEWLDFSKFLDIGKMITGDEDGSSGSSENQFNLYKYNNGSSDYQQLLMHMPLKEVNFDLGEQFKDMDFSKQIQGFNLHEEIVIPKLENLNQETEIDLTDLQNTINNAVSFGGASAPGDLGVTFASSSYFDEVTYTSGSIEVSPFEGGNLIGTVSLYQGSSLVSSGTFINNVAKIDLTGKTLKSSGMIIRFDNPTGTVFKAIIKDGKIHTATDVTIPAGQVTVENPTVSFNMDMSENIKECTVDSGTIKVDFTTTGWSDGAINVYPISTSGGLELSIPDNTEMSINTKVLKPTTIQATANVSLNLSHATIVFANPPKLKVTVNIGEISPTVKLPADYENHVDKPCSLKDLAQYINSITLDPSGFDVTVTNTLPEGNDITLGISSTFLKMDSPGVSHSFPSGSNAVEKSYRGTAATTNAVTETTNVDIDATITLPGYVENGTEKTIKITKVEPNKTYTIDIQVNPVFNWTEANVLLKDTSSEQTNIKGIFESNMNKAEMFKAFGDSFADYADKIEFASIPLYFYAQFPDLDLFKNAGFDGKIEAYYGKKPENGVEANKANTKISNSPEKIIQDGTIELKPMPKLEKNQEGFVTAKLTGNYIDFKDAFNLKAPENLPEGAALCLDYDIKLSGADNNGGAGIKIHPDDLQGLEGSKSIKVDIVLLLTLQFNITEDIPMNLLEMMNKDSESGSGTKTDAEKDLFHRESATTAEDYQKYIDVVKSAELEFTKPKFPFITTGGMSLKVDWGNNEKSECILKDGVNAVVAVNPSTLMKQYPLEPNIEIVIGKGTFGLPRTMEMQAGLKIRVKAEGPIQVYPFDGSKEAN